MKKVEFTSLPTLSFTAQPERFESIKVSSENLVLAEGTHFVVEVPGEGELTHQDVIAALAVVFDDLETELLERLDVLKRNWQLSKTSL